MPDLLRSALSFIVVLGVLVFVHELGHYLAARWRGVHVEVFSIGFGQSLARWTDRRGTVWKLAWLPLGGYVKLHGQERPEDVPDEVRAAWQAGRTFHEKPVASRAIVVAAGPIANFLLAAVLFSAVFMTAGRVPTPDTVLSSVTPGSAAEHAGLRAGDRIDAIDGVPVREFDDVVRIVQAAPDKVLDLRISRDGAAQDLPIKVASQTIDGVREGQIGVGKLAGDPVRLDPAAAVQAGFARAWDIGQRTLAGLWQIVSGQRGTDDLGGPLRIMMLSGQVAQHGFINVVNFIAILSINLGLINLLPIPVLDGGHLLFYLAEAVRGRPLPARAQEYGYRAGFALIASLMLFVTWKDLSRSGAFHWLTALIG